MNRTIQQWLADLEATGAEPMCVQAWTDALAALPPESNADLLFSDWTQGIILADPRLRLWWSELAGWNLYPMWSMSCIDLTGADLSNADLVQADFVGAHLTRVNFSGAKINNAAFSTSFLTGVCFENADLRQADFINTNIKDVLFVAANLKGADLSFSVLHGVSFFGACLNRASIERAKLTMCNFDLARIELLNTTEAEYISCKWIPPAMEHKLW